MNRCSTNDLVTEDILDRTQVQPPLPGVVLGVVHQPQPIRGIGTELALHHIIVSGRTRWSVLVLARGDRRADPRSCVHGFPLR